MTPIGDVMKAYRPGLLLVAALVVFWGILDWTGVAPQSTAEANAALDHVYGMVVHAMSCPAARELPTR
jgi:hypothetical protein